jgi:hypothetical protein
VACNANYALVILRRLTLPQDFDESRIPAELRPEMRSWAQDLTRAEKLMAELDQKLIIDASAENCRSTE